SGKCHFRSHTSSRDIEDSRVAAAAFDHASAVAQRVSALQNITTFHQKLLSLRGQHEVAPDLVEQPRPKPFLKVCNLPGKRRLRNAQLLGCPDDGALLRDGYKCSETLDIHSPNICRFGSDSYPKYALDASGRPWERQQSSSRDLQENRMLTATSRLASR